MKFDTIVIGGGLSGLTAANVLAKKGQRVAIVSNGQSTLHFASGSFDLLGYDNDNKLVKSPLQTIPSLGATHPYTKLGVEKIACLAKEAQELLKDCGIHTTGSADNNHYRITPMGTLKPTWLSIDGMATCGIDEKFAWKKVALVNIAGFLDLPTNFMLAGLAEQGLDIELKTIRLDAFDYARRNPTEMRATNIAKVIHDKKLVETIAVELNKLTGYDAILFPAVAGLRNAKEDKLLRKCVNTPLYYVTPMPPSVMGVRVAMLMMNHFKANGGIEIISNKINGGVIENGSVQYLTANHLPNDKLIAENYILATGSFMSQGLMSDYEHVFEPILNLDIHASNNRDEWMEESVFEPQPYMNFGVATDTVFHPLKDGKAVTNMYAIGSVLEGHNHIKQADNTGVSLLTALQVAKEILK